MSKKMPWYERKTPVYVPKDIQLRQYRISEIKRLKLSGLSTAEIAAELGMTHGALKKFMGSYRL